MRAGLVGSGVGKDKDRLRVLFVAGCWYPHEENPFEGIFVRRHAEAVAHGHHVAVLHPFDLTDGPRRVEVERSQWGAVRQYQARFRKNSSKFASQVGFSRAGRAGARAVLEDFGRPDVVHFHVVPSAGLTLAVLSAFPGTPVVLTEHWSGYLPESGVALSWIRRLYTGWLVRRAGSVTTVSEYHRNAMIRLGFQGNYTVIPNVVDTSVFRPATARTPGPFRLVHVSGLRPEKRAAVIVESVAEAAKGGLDLELHVVGDGPDGDRCRTIADSKGLLGRRIFFHGRQDEAGTARLTRAADASVLFSLFENSPCVIGEAFACGIPVLAPRIGGIPEHVNSDRGLLVAEDDQQGLVRAMGELVRRGQTWDAGAIRDYAERVFSQQAAGERFSRVYAKAGGLDRAAADR